ncbi:MAG TPA: PDR/VanB family oxidoreductase [Homoserinimonas sp.]|nr:PDR/VanB family oxidoreductase [Homoserinimonas sp.]
MSIELRVLTKELIADRVAALTLGSVDGSSLPEWAPGSHIDVTLPGGLIRQYSLCSDPADRTSWRIGVLKELAGRGGSDAVHDLVQVGDTLSAVGPRNNFRYRLPSSDVLFIAGGIGITPILPMVRAADQAGANWRMLYLGRNRASMGFLDELAVYGDRITVHTSDDGGVLPLADGIAATGLDDPEIYACGPGPLLDALGEYWPAGHLHIERFSGDGNGAEATDTAFIVETSDGTEIEVAADETILAAMIRCGVPALNSCQEGICGTCETVVLEGTPLHRDSLLSEEERASNGTMMICVSRCVGDRLVLEL